MNKKSGEKSCGREVVIEAKEIGKEFVNGEVVTKVLHGVSFKIHRGEFVAIMGPSGSGKSTLMHILGFLDTPTSGSFLFEGQEVSTLTDDELAKMRGEKIGFVFQAFNLLPKATVLENVKLPLLYSSVPIAEREKLALKAINAVGLGHRVNNLSNQLSGGERQRVAIARALIRKPSVIFADEPTGNLDSKSGLAIMGILQDLNIQECVTIILVTHETYTAEHAERILRIKDGNIISDSGVDKRRVVKNGEETLK